MLESLSALLYLINILGTCLFGRDGEVDGRWVDRSLCRRACRWLLIKRERERRLWHLNMNNRNSRVSKSRCIIQTAPDSCQHFPQSTIGVKCTDRSLWITPKYVANAVSTENKCTVVNKINKTVFLDSPISYCLIRQRFLRCSQHLCSRRDHCD